MGSLLQSQAVSSSASTREGCAKLRRHDLPPAVMAILNLTPDSFSGDGLLAVDAKDEAIQSEAIQGEANLLRAAERALRAGADWLDLGAQSTRPGAIPLSLEEERVRLLPSLEALLRAFPEALVSVDTSKADLALEAFRLGARMLNDVSGLSRPALWRELEGLEGEANGTERGWVVLMHNTVSRLHRGSLREGGASWQPEVEASSDLPAVLARLSALAQECVAAGVPRERIVLDPGLGFGKTAEQNLVLLRSWSKLFELGFPLMLGASRKSFLGKLLGRVAEAQDSSERFSDRLEGSLAAVAAAMAGGVRILRVHDVAETVRFVRAFSSMRQASASAAFDGS